jgi:integrase
MSGYLMGLGERDASVLRRFEGFCALEGLSVDGALHDGEVVEAFLSISCSRLRAHSLGTYRSTLRRLGVTRTARPFPASFAPAPYGERDLAALWSRARSQGSERRIANATVLLAGLVGAGLRPRELAWLRGGDVLRSREHVSVRVGADGRLVPVQEPSSSVLVALTYAPRDYLFRPGAHVRDAKNLVGEIAAQLVGDPEEVVLSSGRCRSTFLCAHLAHDTPLRELCVMAGLRDVESLLRYARHVPSAPQTKAALRARARQR